MSSVRGVTHVSGLDKDGAGAPRPMKMGTTLSPWRYDAATRHALQSVSLRWPAILRYDLWAAAGFWRVARLPSDSGPLDQSRDRCDGPQPDSAPVIFASPEAWRPRARSP